MATNDNKSNVREALDYAAWLNRRLDEFSTEYIARVHGFPPDRGPDPDYPDYALGKGL